MLSEILRRWWTSALRYVQHDALRTVLLPLGTLVVGAGIWVCAGSFDKKIPDLAQYADSQVWQTHGVLVVPHEDRASALLEATTGASYLLNATAGLPMGTYRFSAELRSDAPVETSLFGWSRTDSWIAMTATPVKVSETWQKFELQVFVGPRSVLGVQIGGNDTFADGEAVYIQRATLTQITNPAPYLGLFLVFAGICTVALSFAPVRLVVSDLRSHPAFQRVYQARWIGTVTASVCLCLIVWLSLLPPNIPKYDSAENFTAAYNLAKHGVLSSSPADNSAELHPDWEREPLYPSVLSFALSLYADLDDQNLECLLAGRSECVHLHYSFFWLNLVILTILTVSTYYAATIVSGSKFGALGAALFVGLSPTTVADLRVANTELIAAPLLLLHSIFLYQVVMSRTPRVFALLSGVCLGLLVFVKIVFLYWVIILLPTIFAVLMWGKREKLSSSAYSLFIVVLSALLVVSAWKPQKHVETIALSSDDSRSGTIGIVLNEYASMTHKEYRAGFVYFTPYIGPNLTKDWFGEDVASRYDRNDPNSYFQRAINTPKDQELAERSLFERLRLVPLFAYRGLFVGGCCVPLGNTLPQYPVRGDSSLAVPLMQLREFFVVSTLFLLPVFLVFSVIYFVKRRADYLLFVMPSLFSFGGYATVSHYIPRYSQPLVPDSVVVLIASIIVLSRFMMPLLWPHAVVARDRLYEFTRKFRLKNGL